MTPSPGIEPGPHWWEASTLTTAHSFFIILCITHDGIQKGRFYISKGPLKYCTTIYTRTKGVRCKRFTFDHFEIYLRMKMEARRKKARKGKRTRKRKKTKRIKKAKEKAKAKVEMR